MHYIPKHRDSGGERPRWTTYLFTQGFPNVAVTRKQRASRWFLRHFYRFWPGTFWETLQRTVRARDVHSLCIKTRRSRVSLSIFPHVDGYTKSTSISQHIMLRLWKTATVILYICSANNTAAASVGTLQYISIKSK